MTTSTRGRSCAPLQSNTRSISKRHGPNCTPISISSSCAGTRKLRTQQKNIARQPADRWSRPIADARDQGQLWRDLATSSIINALERRWSALKVKFDPALFDLPDMGPSPVTSDRPIAVIRPVTVRTEWRNEARNPRPEYIAAIAAELMATHTVVAVADLAPGQEWVVGELPPAHHYFRLRRTRGARAARAGARCRHRGRRRRLDRAGGPRAQGQDLRRAGRPRRPQRTREDHRPAARSVAASGLPYRKSSADARTCCTTATRRSRTRSGSSIAGRAVFESPPDLVAAARHRLLSGRGRARALRSGLFRQLRSQCAAPSSGGR